MCAFLTSRAGKVSLLKEGGAPPSNKNVCGFIKHFYRTSLSKEIEIVISLQARPSQRRHGERAANSREFVCCSLVWAVLLNKAPAFVRSSFCLAAAHVDCTLSRLVDLTVRRVVFVRRSFLIQPCERTMATIKPYRARASAKIIMRMRAIRISL